MSNVLNVLRGQLQELRAEKAETQKQIDGLKSLQRKVVTLDKQIRVLREATSKLEPPSRSKSPVGARKRRTRKDRTELRTRVVQVVREAGVEGIPRKTILLRCGIKGDKSAEAYVSQRLDRHIKEGSMRRRDPSTNPNSRWKNYTVVAPSSDSRL